MRVWSVYRETRRRGIRMKTRIKTRKWKWKWERRGEEMRWTRELKAMMKIFLTYMAHIDIYKHTYKHIYIYKPAFTSLYTYLTYNIHILILPATPLFLSCFNPLGFHHLSPRFFPSSCPNPSWSFSEPQLHALA